MDGSATQRYWLVAAAVRRKRLDEPKIASAGVEPPEAPAPNLSAANALLTAAPRAAGAAALSIVSPACSWVSCGAAAAMETGAVVSSGKVEGVEETSGLV